MEVCTERGCLALGGCSVMLRGCRQDFVDFDGRRRRRARGQETLEERGFSLWWGLCSLNRPPCLACVGVLLTKYEIGTYQSLPH